MSARYITFDVMLRDRFVCTLRMPVYLADDYENGRFIFTAETLSRFVESKRPTLKGKPYNICF